MTYHVTKWSSVITWPFSLKSRDCGVHDWRSFSFVQSSNLRADGKLVANTQLDLRPVIRHQLTQIVVCVAFRPGFIYILACDVPRCESKLGLLFFKEKSNQQHHQQ